MRFHQRPPHGKAQAHPGKHPVSEFHASQAFQPLPTPLGKPPYHYPLESVIPGVTNSAAKSLTFHVVGDTGGIKRPEFQMAVAHAMEEDLKRRERTPLFMYHVGDVVYFNGEIEQYYSQK